MASARAASAAADRVVRLRRRQRLPERQTRSTPTPMASARAAPRRRRPAFFNAAPAGPRTAVCPRWRRSPPRAARARAPTRPASPGGPALRLRAGAARRRVLPARAPPRDPRRLVAPPCALALATPERPRIRPCWRVTARSWPEGGVAFGRG